MGEADTVRRGFAKKTGTEQYLPKIKDGFCAYMNSEYGMQREEAEQLAESFLRVIEDSSYYLFSLNHSQPYSIIGYESAWLRHYYPIEFIANYLEYSKDKEEKTIRAIEYANSNGIEIKPPKFRYSKSKYMPDKSTNSIYKGISSIKYLSEKVADELYELRDNKYDSFTDLLVDIKTKTSTDSRQLNILTTLGFFSEFGKNKKLLTVIEAYDKIANRKQLKIAESDNLIVPLSIILSHAQITTEKMIKDFNGVDIVREFESTVENKSIGLKERLAFEQENMGYIAFTYDKATKNMYYVIEFKTYKNKSKPYLTLYQVKTGETIKAKIINEEVYMSAPFKEGNVLLVDKMSKKPKSKLVNGKWVKSQTEKDNILDSYQVF
jgi:DNA polymerase-3 subunit alpha